MGKTNFEWQVGENDWDDEVELLTFDPRNEAPRPASRLRAVPRRLVWALTGLGVLAMALVGWRLWAGYQEGMARVRQDIQATTDLEAWAWLNRDDKLKETLVAPDASAGWRTRAGWADNRLRDLVGDTAQPPQVQLSELELKGDLALVKATVNLPSAPNQVGGYSEFRFYERQPDGVWRRTSPDARFWGDERTLTSDHFQVTYRMRDHAAVRAFVPRLEAFYTQAVQTLRLDGKIAGPFQLQIVPTLEGTTFRISDERRLTIASPLLQPTVLGTQQEDTLLRAVTFPLSSYLIERATDHVTSQGDWNWGEWRRVSVGIGQWLALEAAGLPPVSQLQMEADFKRDLAGGARPTLLALNSYRPPAFTSRLGSGMLSVSFAEFIAATYGRDAVGALVAGLPAASTWDDLARQVFNTDSGSLEAAWQTYVMRRYGNENARAGATQ